MIRSAAATLLTVFALPAFAQPLTTGVPPDREELPGVEVLQERAEAMKAHARTPTGAAYLDATNALPEQLRRFLWVDRMFNSAYTEQEYNDLDERRKTILSFRPVTELAYYMGARERPLMDFLALDLVVAGTDMAEPSNMAGRKILLYNPRVITQGRLLASLGADVTILHKQIRMRGLYSQPKDQGTIENVLGGSDGSLRLLYADWPAEEANVGEGYDLVIISDWVSEGLSTPSPVPPRWVTPGSPLRGMKSSPDVFLKAIAERMAPGGRVINYAFGPIEPRQAQSNQPYSNVRAPYSPEAIDEAGLEVVVLDASDTRAFVETSIATNTARIMMNPQGVPTLLAAYSIFEKPARSEGASNGDG